MAAALAVIGSVAVLLGFVTAVLGLLNQRQVRQGAAANVATSTKVDAISVNVDGRLSMLFERQAQLLNALHASGTPVPPFPPAREEKHL